MSNLKKVAEKAKVSPITVSRVINSPEMVSKKTIEKVKRAMEELNYSINPAAQALAANRTNVIDVYVPSHIELEDLYVMQLISGISEVCNRNMYSFLITGNRKQTNACDGYIVTGVHEDELDEMIRHAEEQGRAITLFGHTDRADVNYVDIDNTYGAQMMVEYLIEQGHTEIGLLNIKEEKVSNHTAEREKGYKQALEAHGLSVQKDRIFYAENNVQSAYEAAMKILKHSNATAFFCTTDILALGLIQACGEMGISVPEQLSVGGFDGFGYQNVTWPHITTVKQPIFQIGQRLATLLIEQLKSKKNEEAHEIVKPVFLKGGTVKKKGRENNDRAGKNMGKQSGDSSSERFAGGHRNSFG